MEFPDDVNELVDQLVGGIHQEIGHNLIGIYPRGSLAHGDFNPNTSDIDILVVTNRSINEEEFGRLSKFHKRIASLPNPYSKEIEITYIGKEDAKEFVPNQKHPTLYRGEREKLGWVEHGHNWMLERRTVLEYGKVYLGPNPRKLIKPISEDKLRYSVCERMKDWAKWARDDNDPDWKLPNYRKVYFVETMCRAICTLETGKLASKAESVSWAIDHLPSEWRQFVEQSRGWQGDESVNLSVNQPLRNFVLWVASSSRCAT